MNPGLRGAGIAQAALTPVKVNMLVKRGMNDHSLLDMADRFRGDGGTFFASSSTWT